MKIKLLSALLVLAGAGISTQALAFGWDYGSDGTIYCYGTDSNGNTLPNTNPVAWNHCHQYSEWGYDSNNVLWCFPVGSNGNLPAGVTAIGYSSCHVSYKMQDGYCYPADSFGNLPAGLSPVDSSYCSQ